MDLNSYLTDFFKLLKHSDNNLYGGYNMRGGDLSLAGKLTTAHGPTPTRDQILKFYFVGLDANTANIDSNIQFNQDPEIQEEFKKAQVGIVKYMLDGTTQQLGGARRNMYGGTNEDKKATSAVAKALLPQTKECSLLTKVKAGNPDYTPTDVTFADDEAATACVDSIINYIKAIKPTFTDRDLLRDEVVGLTLSMDGITLLSAIDLHRDLIVGLLLSDSLN